MGGEQMKRAILYCPKHVALKQTKKRWEKIAALLAKHEIEYDLIQSENEASVERLVSMLIHNGYDDIILAGGDSALNDACNCLMREEKEVRSRVCLGIIPNGLMNDFASFWGFRENKLEDVIESLKIHRTRKIDVCCARYNGKNDSIETRYFLNCINVGLIAVIQTLRLQTKKILWSRKISYLISLILLIFMRKEYKVKYTINYEPEKRNIMTMCIGNALGYGQTPNAVPYNGMVDVTVLTNSKLTQLFSAVSLYLRGRILNHKGVHPYRCREVKLLLSQYTPITIDGRNVALSPKKRELNISVEQEAINFIIEK